MTEGPPFAIRALDPAADRAAVADLYAWAADYVVLETGAPPDGATVRAFFADVPPGGDLARSLKLGLFLPDGGLAGIADLGFGFPEPADAYLGLMLIDPARRGLGLGPRFLDRLAADARARGAPRLLLAVLDANPRGRAFWEREGFRVVLTAPPALLGRRTHVRHRMARPLSRTRADGVPAPGGPGAP
jgi:GNAT superfamily N-acetyltransferase